MNIFLDTEFSGLAPEQMELISVGLVAETGELCYIEIDDCSWSPERCSDFVRQAVLPLLDPPETRLPIEASAKKILAFLEQWPEIDFYSDAPGVDFELRQALLYDAGFRFPGHWKFFRLQFDDRAQAKKHYEAVEAFYAAGGRRHRADDDARALAAGYLAATKGGQ